MKKSLLLPLSFCLCSCSDFASNYVDMWSDFFAGDLLEDDFSASSSSAQSFDNYTPPSSSSNVLNGYNPIYSSSSSVNISSSSELESSFSKMLILSSSSVRSSSSIENFINSLRDSRDGQTYKYVKIGNQVWMAENLNYETANSYCYNDNSTNCEKYGRLYEWSAALNACPIGWHLPSDADFEILVEAVGGENVAGKNLKSTTGWDLCGNGVDFGFNALPGGGTAAAVAVSVAWAITRISGVLQRTMRVVLTTWNCIITTSVRIWTTLVRVALTRFVVSGIDAYASVSVCSVMSIRASTVAATFAVLDFQLTLVTESLEGRCQAKQAANISFAKAGRIVMANVVWRSVGNRIVSITTFHRNDKNLTQELRARFIARDKTKN